MLAAKKRVGNVLRTATFVGQRVILFKDGSVAWIHACTGKISEAADVAEAGVNAAASIGDQEGRFAGAWTNPPPKFA
jgi:hypothetical protein